MRTLFSAIGLLAGMAVAPAAAQTTPPPPEVLSAVYECTAVTDSAARLSCYDQAVGRLRQAQTGGELVAVDRGQIETIERESFGFSLPSLSSFMPNFRGGDDDNGLARMEMTVERVVTRGSGRQALVMENGQIWADIEIVTNPLVRDGDTVVIRRGPLGNFLMSSSRGGAARRVRREG